MNPGGVKSIRFGAIGLSLLVFAVLYFGLTITGNVLARPGASTTALVPWLNVAVYLVWLGCGVLTARFAKRAGVLNGALYGLGTVVLVVGPYYVLGGSAEVARAFWADWYIWLLNGVLLGAGGGLLWEFSAMSRRRKI